MTKKQNEITGAKFSPCHQYRYALWRIWDDTLDKVLFIGLNPSLANQTTDDPTIRRCKQFATDWGYGGMYMLNLFAYITPYPHELLRCADPVGQNDQYIEEYAQKVKRIVFCWGANNIAKNRGKQIMERYEGYALTINKDGSPRHPLYVHQNIKIIRLIT